MSLSKFINQVVAVFISVWEFLFYPGASAVIANLKELSATAKTYEEWLRYQEELNVLSQRNIWSANAPFFSE